MMEYHTPVHQFCTLLYTTRYMYVYLNSTNSPISEAILYMYMHLIQHNGTGFTFYSAYMYNVDI